VSNAVIERQRIYLESLDNGDESGTAGAPTSDLPAGVPGQEPPDADGQVAVPPAAPDLRPPTPEPQAGSDEALKQQITVLEGKVKEYESLYQRQHGMVAPLQRKTAEQERTIADLKRQIEDLQASGSAAPPAAAQVQPPPTSLSADDPKLQEFMSIYADMIPGLEALIQQRVGVAVQPHLEQSQAAIKFAEQQRLQEERASVLKEHLAPLYAKYPQAGATVASPQFIDWVEKQSSYLRDSIVDRIKNPENYPILEVVEIFDDFSRTGQQAPPPTSRQVAPSPGEMAIDTRRIPTSSTPGGKPEPQPLTRERLAYINRELTVNRSLHTEAEIASLKQEMEQGERAANSAGYGLSPRLDTLSR